MTPSHLEIHYTVTNDLEVVILEHYARPKWPHWISVLTYRNENAGKLMPAMWTQVRGAEHCALFVENLDVARETAERIVTRLQQETLS